MKNTKDLITKFDYQDPDYLETFMTDQKKLYHVAQLIYQ